MSGLDGYEAPDVVEETEGQAQHGGPTLLAGATHAVARVAGGDQAAELRAQLQGIQQDWEAEEAFEELGWLVRLPGLIRLGITIVLSVLTLRRWVDRKGVKHGQVGGDSDPGADSPGGSVAQKEEGRDAE